MDYNLGEDVLTEINEQQAMKGDASLPFAAPLLYVVNGSGRKDMLESKTQTAAQVFGGWAIDGGEAENIEARTGRSLPSYFERATISTKRSGSIDVLTARAVPVALIYARSSWLTTLPALRRSSKYFEGARRHVHALVMLGHRRDPAASKIFIWGPALLSAKGFQAKRLLDAFDEWASVTAASRRIIRPDGTLPASLFWTVIGTFGPEIKQEMVGKGVNTSTITPIGCYQPKDINQQALDTLYGGEELAVALLEHGREAKVWRELWAEFETMPDDPAAAAGHTPFRDAQPDDEDIPF